MTATTADPAVCQYLTFLLGEEEYAVDILRVQEIKGLSRVTPIPNSPPHVKGVMNLRGTVVPVLDLRTRFGLPLAEYTRFSVVVLVTVAGKVIGLVVDAVSDVVEMPADRIEPPPDVIENDNTAYLNGLAKTGERMLAVLNIDRLIAADTKHPN